MTEKEIKKKRNELQKKLCDLYAPLKKEEKKILKEIKKLQKECTHPFGYVNFVGEYTLEYQTCSLCGAYSTKDDWSDV